ncbi:MAG: hypothetical protein J6M66_08140 [Lachnospiraceae bacterium]|nr:hypothetical protein [Lachnospiraceae bacterium]
MSYFIRQFSKKMGMSPTDYREMVWQAKA